MSGDLISRSAVIKVLEECNLDRQLFEKDVFDKVEVISQIEAVPVVRGEWNSVYTNNSCAKVGFCSNCGYQKEFDNFCGNCGAKMKPLKNVTV